MYQYVVLLTSLKHQHHSGCSLLAGVEDPNASPNISSMIVEVEIYLKWYWLDTRTLLSKLKSIKYEDGIHLWQKQQHFQLTHVKALFTFSSSTNAKVTLPWMSSCPPKPSIFLLLHCGIPSAHRSLLSTWDHLSIISNWLSVFVEHSSLPILESEYKTPLSASHHSHISLYTCGSAGLDNIRMTFKDQLPYMFIQKRRGYIYFQVDMM